MARKPTKKVRVELRKNQQTRSRRNNLTRDYSGERINEDQLLNSERVSGKGALSRKRTIVSSETSEAGDDYQIAVNEADCLLGRVITAQGLHSTVDVGEGKTLLCATRRLLKSFDKDQRQSVVTGDRVLVRQVNDQEGMIERIEPRQGILSRTSKGRQHVIAANVQQLLIVTSAAEPTMKPNLIDRMLISAEQGGIEPIICINKIDLIDPAELQPIIGVYSQLGYRILALSAKTGQNTRLLGKLCQGRQTAVAGQSGVGKSSLLNCIEPDLHLRVGTVSEENQKGRHTTTSAVLLWLEAGGYLVDTPGIRQFELWDVVPEEIAGFFRDIRPYVSFCRFPNCTHTHEADCAVKDAVADHYIDARRYESYLHLLEGDPA